MSLQSEHKRWQDCTRLLAPGSGAAPAERVVAERELNRLREKHGTQGPPSAYSDTFSTTQDPLGDVMRAMHRGEQGRARRAAYQNREAQENERKQRARAAERERVLKHQREQIESIPDWQVEAELRRLHLANEEWGVVEMATVTRLGRERRHPTGVSLSELGTVLAGLGAAAGLPLTPYDERQLSDILSGLAERMMSRGHLVWFQKKVALAQKSG